MSKGNMMQGMARGKVGDLVFSRLDGEQITRLRNRHPKNPRTNKQLYQRAVMASIMMAYSAGKQLFDHAFEGYAVGGANQRRFMSLNAKRLRAQLADDIENYNVIELNPSKAKGRFVAPGSISPTPCSIQISEGSYDQSLFTKSSDANGDAQFSTPAATTNQTVAQYAAAHNLIAGDIYTIVAFAADGDNVVYVYQGEEASGYDVVYNTKLAFVRLIVKAGLESVTDTVATLGQLFTVEETINVKADFTAVAVGSPILVKTLTADADGFNIGSIGVIRSRRDADLRSTSYMYLSENAGTSGDYMDGSGLIVTNVLEAWKAGTQSVGDSELILEGGNF